MKKKVILIICIILTFAAGVLIGKFVLSRNNKEIEINEEKIKNIYIK